MKKFQLKQLIKEEIHKILKETKEDKYLIMVSSFTDKDGDWHNKDWFFDPSFKTQGLTAEYGKGANGRGWGKPVILCASYMGGNPFDGFHDEWKWAVIFKKNINEIYLDDEIFHFGKYPSKDIENQAIDFIQKNIDESKDTSLGNLYNEFGVEITQNNHPYGNYVLNIKPNEIIKIEKNVLS
jgi:hypothetical protein